MPKVLFAGDHPLNKYTAGTLTQSRFQITSLAADGYELLQYLYTTHEIPDVLIINIQMPRIDGIALTNYIKHHFPAIKTIILSKHNEISLISQAFNSGANGFLLEDSFEKNASRAINTVRRNKLFIDEKVKTSANEIEQYANDIINKQKFKKFRLTKREQTFLLLSATKLQYAAIAKLMFVEPATVQTYFERVARKIGVTSRQELTLLSLQYGLVKILFYPDTILL